MKIKLHPTLYLSKPGKRPLNEDYIYPGTDQFAPVERLFLVCDGVKGNAGGDVASRLACMSLVDYIAAHPGEVYDAAFFAQAINKVKDDFEKYISLHPAVCDMATTATLAYFTSAGVCLAHCGDSRIYHLRDNSIKYVSKDHSYLNYLLDIGEITQEEMNEHPMSNVIIRAISLQSPLIAKMEIMNTPDVKSGDYFFLCTDGVLKALQEEKLIEILSGSANNQLKIKQIEQLCDQYAEDNFSCYLIQVDSVTDKGIPM